MEDYLASIIMWPVSWEPLYYSFCQGQILQVNSNQALFALIGTVYGGNGSSTFALPDFRGKVPIGIDNANYLYGKSGGSATSSFSAAAQGSITLTAAQMPAHTHSTPGGTFTISIPANNTTSTTNTDTPGPTTVLARPTVNNTLPVVNTTAKAYSTAAPNTNLLPFSVTAQAGTSGSAGTGAAIPISLPVAGSVSTIQPWIAMNFMICTAGIYPQRQ